ncbi:hypothetical protein BpHYR1_017265 [Brachionus plicatilis]|uniref:Uncharacterized protein n=1 Tax=Brachionus plicatilis TaxID=10195 RepID=A0A3M7R2M5_BRAPC|nr:hypothetical protein BpHYR1_017265 [Brachionus plicatilis]
MFTLEKTRGHSIKIRITPKKRENNQYVITKCNLKHENHQISKELYMHNHSKRKLTEQEAQEAYDMYKTGGNVKLIVQTMAVKTGKPLQIILAFQNIKSFMRQNRRKKKSQNQKNLKKFSFKKNFFSSLKNKTKKNQ